MKMKKNWKRFFTLDRHHAEGFTLVELIVVIAILAILAGVAVPAYSGYITKANRVADEQLLDAMTNAFHSACIEENISILDLENTKVVLNDDNTFFGFDFDKAKVDPSETLSAAPSVSPDPFTTTFMVYFGTESQKQAFTVITDIIFRNGSFMDATTLGGVFTDIFNTLGDKITASVSALNGSTFGEIGAEGLMEKVDVVTGLAAGLAGKHSGFSAVLDNNLPSMAVAMGYTLGEDGYPGMDFWNDLGAMAAEKAAKDNPGVEVTDKMTNAAMKEMLANYAVLEAAKSTTGNAKDQLATLQTTDLTAIKNLMSQNEDVGSTKEGMTQAAMMYAMYTAYANALPEGTEAEREAKKTALENANDVTKFMDAIDKDTGFRTYLNDPDSKAEDDLAGYLGALDIINQSIETDNTGSTVTDLVVNGYTNPDLVDALQGLLGN